MKPSVQFAQRKDGITIAYSVFGNAPPFIYSVTWVTDLAFFLEDKHCYEFWQKLSRAATVVLYDKHGCGQSDRERTASNCMKFHGKNKKFFLCDLASLREERKL